MILFHTLIKIFLLKNGLKNDLFDSITYEKYEINRAKKIILYTIIANLMIRFWHD